MILQNIIELIQDEYPEYGEGYLKFRFNKEYKRFCHETKLIRDTVTIFSDAGTWKYNDKVVSIDLSELNIDIVKEISFYDVNDNLTTIPIPYEYSFNGKYMELLFDKSVAYASNGIWVTNDGTPVIDSLSNYIFFGDLFKTISLKVVKVPVELSVLTDNTEIDDEDAETVIIKIKEQLAMRAKDYTAATYLRGIYKEGVIEAMRKGNEGKDGTALKPNMYFY